MLDKVTKRAVRTLVPLSLRKRLAVWVHRQRWLGSDRRNWWSTELVRDFADSDVNAYHKFLWTHHLGYAAPYEVSTRFGVENMRPSRQEFFAELRNSLETLGVAVDNVRSVLEVGCSLGYQLRYLETEMLRGATMLDGIDIDEYAVRNGQQYLDQIGSKISLTCGDMQHLDQLLGERTYDVVVCTGVLMYLRENEADMLVRKMLSRSRTVVGLAGLAHPAIDNAALASSGVRERDRTFIHNLDVMVKAGGGRIVSRRWDGQRTLQGQTIYFVFASPA